MESKQCPRCNLTKPKEKFHLRFPSSGRLTLSSYCKECGKAQKRDQYARAKRDNGDQCHLPYGKRRLGRSATEADWKMHNMHQSAKKRSRKKGRLCNITIEDIRELYTERCPLLDIELDWETSGGKRASDNSPSLDRVDSSKGYVKGNLWIVSWRANMIKNDATPQELLAIANALLAR